MKSIMAKRVIRILAVAAISLIGTATSASATATTGNQTFTGYETGNQGNFQGFTSSLNVANGIINAVGHDVAQYPDMANFDRDDFVFPRGTLFTEIQTDSPASIDPRTCFGQGPLTGIANIVGGSGAYQGATGSLTLTGRLILIAAFDHGTCSSTDVTFIAVFTAKGSLTLP